MRWAAWKRNRADDGTAEAAVIALEPGTLAFRCNICGVDQTRPAETMAREGPTCEACGSTGRWRSVVDVLSRELFGTCCTLADLPRRPGLRGIGLTDWPGYADVFAERFDYTNTALHQEPRLDLLDPGAAPFRDLDFLIASDVFEHVDPPVSRAFENALGLLRPGGLLLLTVPYRPRPDTQEHFPELFDYRLVERDDALVLVNTTRDGREQVFERLTFHGGYGHTLELRLFGRGALRRDLEAAGFETVTFHERPCFAHGVWWPGGLSYPVTARRPAPPSR